MILNEKTQNKKTLSNLDLLLKSLKKEEICIARKILLNNVQNNSSGRIGQDIYCQGGRCQSQRDNQRGTWGEQDGQDNKKKENSATNLKDITCH